MTDVINITINISKVKNARLWAVSLSCVDFIIHSQNRMKGYSIYTSVFIHEALYTESTY